LNNTSLGLTLPSSVSGLATGDHVMTAIQESDAAVYASDDIDFSSVVTIAASNASFMIQLDMGAAVAATIASAGYATAAALAAAIETAVDTALGADAAEVTVSASGNAIQFTSADHGSASSIGISDAATGSALETIMLSSGVEVGQDAIVTLDNFENRISEVDNTTASSATLYDASGNSVGFTLGSTSDGIDLGTTILTYQAEQFLASLDGGSKVRFDADVVGTIENGSDKLSITFGSSVASGTSILQVSDNSLQFQIGANEDQNVDLSIASMSSSQLGLINQKLSSIDVTTAAGANAAIEVIDAAISQVSTERSELGAFSINVLESTLNSLQVSEENLTAAESILRDTDFASEMAEFTKNQILEQAGIAILAQANMMPQSVLTLLG
jgi:flagellin